MHSGKGKGLGNIPPPLLRREVLLRLPCGPTGHLRPCPPSERASSRAPGGRSRRHIHDDVHSSYGPRRFQGRYQGGHSQVVPPRFCPGVIRLAPVLPVLRGIRYARPPPIGGTPGGLRSPHAATRRLSVPTGLQPRKPGNHLALGRAPICGHLCPTRSGCSAPAAHARGCRRPPKDPFPPRAHRG
jgi:hypothetical protein